MYNRFDELTKSLAQSVTRRGALKKFGAGLAGMALACFGLARKADAANPQGYCQVQGDFLNARYTGMCMDISGCVWASSSDCPAAGTSAGTINKKGAGGFKNACGYLYNSGKKCSFTI